MTATWLDPPLTAVRDVVARALAEDLGVFGDVTASLVPSTATVTRVPRRPGRRACWPAGWRPPRRSRPSIPAIAVQWAAADGDRVEAGQVLARVSGPLASVLTAERTALNLLGHLSGVATLTRRFVDAAGSDRPHPRHPQDHARTAGPGEGRRARRRRGQPPGLALRRHPAQGQPPGRHLHRGRRRRGQAALARAGRARWSATPSTRSSVAVAAGADLVLVDNMDAAERRRRPSSSSAAASPSRCPVASRSTTVAGYAAAGADLICGRRPDPLRPGARHRRWTWSAEPCWSAIDVGNTQTVIGPVRARRRPGRQQQRAAPPLAHRHRRLPDRGRDGAADRPAVPAAGPRPGGGHHRHRRGVGRAPACGPRCGR